MTLLCALPPEGFGGIALPDLTAFAMLAALCVYALLGGADYGGGVLELFVRGPRAAEQRATIERAIAPVWEANHVWLIIAVVVLFTGFPAAFAAIATALHVPLVLLLVGVVLRGAAFTFRHYDDRGESAQKRWGRVFALASSATPLFLGAIVAAVASGRVRLDARGVPEGGFFAPWLGPFPLAAGLFTALLFTFEAAVYLTVEARTRALADDFRRAAFVAGALVFVAAFATRFAAGPGTASFQARLLESGWSLPLQIGTGLVAASAFVALAARRFRLARALVAAQVTLILLGFGLAQRPFLVAPDLTIAEAAAPPRTLRLLLAALAAGAVVIAPSLYALFRVFKREPAFAPLDDE